MGMKAKHIITTCGILLGGLVVSQGASAVVTYETSSNVQFTFNPVLTLTLTGDGFVIDNLVPSMSAISNEVTASVSTNSVAGYTLSATVGDTTYNSTSLISGANTISMMVSGTSLTAGHWGYTLDNGTTYGALDTTNSTVLARTSTAASSDVTHIKIGAYASSSQPEGIYRNVMNLAATTNVITHTITLAAGSNVSSVVLGSSGTSHTYSEGETVAISATCTSGHTFNNWNKSVDYGQIANPATASTNYTVGAGDVTITAYCE